ncbi:MAG: Uma2 family endonuclease [Synechococcales bacterium]|nr:Uma2 family endonuclease [Synechococcales bacterium]
MTALIVNLKPAIDLTDDQFYELCLRNRDLKFERNAQGDLIIMSPTGGESSQREAEVITDLGLWNRQTGLGKVFSSSGGFKLPNGADRAPDAAWVALGRWNALTPTQRQKFPPLCPDFIIEIRSPNDSLSTLQEKMQEYLENGMQLGLLLNPQDRQVEVYRLGQAVEVLANPDRVSCDPTLPGFVLELGRIFELDA